MISGKIFYSLIYFQPIHNTIWIYVSTCRYTPTHPATYIFLLLYEFTPSFDTICCHFCFIRCRWVSNVKSCKWLDSFAWMMWWSPSKKWKNKIGIFLGNIIFSRILNSNMKSRRSILKEKKIKQIRYSIIAHHLIIMIMWFQANRLKILKTSEPIDFES